MRSTKVFEVASMKSPRPSESETAEKRTWSSWMSLGSSWWSWELNQRRSRQPERGLQLASMVAGISLQGTSVYYKKKMEKIFTRETLKWNHKGTIYEVLLI